MSTFCCPYCGRFSTVDHAHQPSARELEIIGLVARGYRNKEIGERLFISEQTVKNHLHNIFDKLPELRSNRLQLALWAISRGLVSSGGKVTAEEGGER